MQICRNRQVRPSSELTAFLYAEPHSRKSQVVYPKDMLSQLSNYLRSYRRQCGLSQSEVAFLLGSHNGAQVSRYERGHYLPPLRTALAYTTIFGVSLGELFSGIQIGVHKEILPRIKELRTRLENRRKEHQATAADVRKLRWLDERWPGARN
jgi:transcriptional regulator with XRE-family HTH domain